MYGTPTKTVWAESPISLLEHQTWAKLVLRFIYLVVSSIHAVISFHLSTYEKNVLVSPIIFEGYVYEYVYNEWFKEMFFSDSHFMF